MTHLAGEPSHPPSRIVADLHFSDGQVRGMVTLQGGLHGAFYCDGKMVAVQAGAQSIAI